jgi:ferredoxin
MQKILPGFFCLTVENEYFVVNDEGKSYTHTNETHD